MSLNDYPAVEGRDSADLLVECPMSDRFWSAPIMRFDAVKQDRWRL